MDEDIDKKRNRERGFPHPPIDPELQIRLLRLKNAPDHPTASYSLETISISDLPSIKYRALSYTWGQARSPGDIDDITISDQPFTVRSNLSAFLSRAAAKREAGLFFIDAICINQLSMPERQSQIKHMARIYRNADQVVAWLGQPDETQLENVRSLAGAKSAHNAAHWSSSQWAGFRYLTYHPYWTRVWVVQEVLLATNMVVWCGAFAFSLSLLGWAAPASIVAAHRHVVLRGPGGKPSAVASPATRCQSPAERVIAHRTRHVFKPVRDPMAQGTRVGTLKEMTAALQRPTYEVKTYQSMAPDLYHEVIRKFGRLQCSNPSDKLYGFLGIIREKSCKAVQADYTQGPGYAFAQALKLGFLEIYNEYGAVENVDVYSQKGYWIHRANNAYLSFYCNARDAFGIHDEESLQILGQVLQEIGFREREGDAIAKAQWLNQFDLRGGPYSLRRDFKDLLQLVANDEEVEDVEELVSPSLRTRHPKRRYQKGRGFLRPLSRQPRKPESRHVLVV